MSHDPAFSNESDISVYDWPAIDKPEFELANKITDHLRAMQSKRNEARGAGITKHVEDEENLQDDCIAILNQIRSGNLKINGIQPAVINQLNSDDQFFRAAVKALKMRGSFFYPISVLMYNWSDIEEISCESWNRFLVSRGGKVFRVLGGFDNEAQCIAFFTSILETIGGVTGDTTFNKAEPIAEANFGSIARVTVAVKPALSVRQNLQASIRIHGHSRVKSLHQGYVENGIIPLGAAQFLEACVKGRVNILFTGATRTGKTTLLRICCGLFAPTDRVVVIEDNAELALDRPDRTGKQYTENVFGFTTLKSARIDQKYALSLADLVRHALRFAPDRIIMGEARGAEMADICKALTSGHDGSMSTIHSEDALSSIGKIAEYLREDERYRGDVELSQAIAHDAFNLIVHLGFFNRRRVLTGIAAVSRGNDKFIYKINQVGTLEQQVKTIEDLPVSVRTRISKYFPDGMLPPVNGSSTYKLSK